MANKSISDMYDTSYFDGVSCLLITADSRKSNSRINKTPHSHTMNQTRKATEVHGSTSIRAMYDTSYFDEASYSLVTADPPKTNSRRVVKYSNPRFTELLKQDYSPPVQRNSLIISPTECH